MRLVNVFGAVGALMALAAPALAQDLPAGYPADYASVVAAAKKEGKVVIYTSTDAAQSQALVDAFTKKFGIAVDYEDLNTNNGYNRIISEAAADQVGADVAWSSGMDLQMALATDGHIDGYASPEAAALPDWAKYKDQLYATTIEPIGMIYNKNALPPDRVPTTRAGLIAFLRSDAKDLQGRVATFDPEKSGTGFLHDTNDVRQTKDFWDVAKALGAVKVRTYSSSGSMRETVVSGENVLAFNIIGSYALDWVKQTPNLGVAFGKDYTAAFSRAAGVVKGAPHPNAAKVFLDFMLSKEGQEASASKGLPSVRTDVAAGLNRDSLNALVGGNLKPIALDEGLLEYLEPQKRVGFFKEWKVALNQ